MCEEQVSCNAAVHLQLWCSRQSFLPSGFFLTGWWCAETSATGTGYKMSLGSNMHHHITQEVSHCVGRWAPSVSYIIVAFRELCLEARHRGLASSARAPTEAWQGLTRARAKALSFGLGWPADLKQQERVWCRAGRAGCWGLLHSGRIKSYRQRKSICHLQAAILGIERVMALPKLSTEQRVFRRVDAVEVLQHRSRRVM